MFEIIERDHYKPFVVQREGKDRPCTTGFDTNAEAEQWIVEMERALSIGDADG